MSTAHAGSPEPPRQLEEGLAAYLRAVGEPGASAPGGRVPAVPDRGQWLARYPDLAPELRRFFANRDRIERLAATVRGGAPARGAGGERPFGDYELLEEIARGGMGVVYRARQVRLN